MDADIGQNGSTKRAKNTKRKKRARLSKKDERRITEILEDFDFTKARWLIENDIEYMSDANNYDVEDNIAKEMADSYKKMKVPSIPSLILLAKDLLTEAITERLSVVATGFLRVERYEYENYDKTGKYHISLSLDLEEIFSDDDDDD